ncbi:hypothetical protein VR010_05845, partial [Actinomycetaceae bacterium L2_0104]
STPGPSPATGTPVNFDEPIESELNEDGIWQGALTVTAPTTTLFFVSTYGDADLTMSIKGQGMNDIYSYDRSEIFATFTTNPSDPAIAARLEPGEYQIELQSFSYEDSSFMLETFAATEISTGETLLEGTELGPEEGWRAHFLTTNIPSAGEWEFDIVTTSGEVSLGVFGTKSKLPKSSSGSTAGKGSEKDPNIVTYLDAETTLVIVQEKTFQPFDATLTVTAL